MINGKIYVGQDSNDNFEYLGSGKLIQKAIKKYGKQNFVKEILEKCVSLEELNKREIFWINQLNACDKSIGYNIAEGGNGYWRHGYSDDEKLIFNKKISAGTKTFFETDKGLQIKKYLSELRKGKTYEEIMGEEKSKIVKEKKSSWMKKNNPMNDVDFSGEKNPFYNKKHTHDSIKKMSEKKLGNSYAKGMKHTDETKKKMSESADHRGSKNSMYGKSLYDVWYEKYPKEIVEEKIRSWKEKLGKSSKNKKK